MKKISILFTTAFLFAVILVSCKKEVVTNTIYIKDTTISNTTTIRDTMYGSVVGFWPGTFENAGFFPDTQFSYLFKNDGSVIVYVEGADTASATFIGTGQYKVTDSVVVTLLNIAGSVYSTVDTIRKGSSLFFEGTIGQGLNTSGFAVNIAHKE